MNYQKTKLLGSYEVEFIQNAENGETPFDDQTMSSWECKAGFYKDCHISLTCCLDSDEPTMPEPEPSSTQTSKSQKASGSPTAQQTPDASNSGKRSARKRS